MNSKPATHPELPDAEAQCVELAALIRQQLHPDTLLVGVHSGGAWVARRLHQLLDLPGEIGLIDVSFHRDDYGARGLHPRVRPSSIPFDVEGRPLILVDDVVYTGRTTRAAINELFDYGRPASIQLAVLADRGRRQLPICADFCPWYVNLDPALELVLSTDAEGRLRWSVEAHA
ncbi:bifunctional pyr operon transcriptional regulator/uracil phosphoribosyltransferase PyrR [Accumulibacter sp.]|uniref:bifunctional pyr operon transcriptional regulator/uracil phosphoribosyltransferase PyrR n=1 Tax=Accumulibacter sp. TaxID=2053492 RepID=UPI0025E8436F|nr:bifunctional pyr operon transcriptional regulator/uracil phosphoribosyltransferase PyrR [Accumulibacter sp.]MCM8594424.1 bifunctional pyr operon transcriptional regulator/uracil phosphoribosyltransferase PyrR [Accumulibacter sp.]MCM8624940.1 bifunctional pyr operon transcriptional regulator/uracil phosphoribosyltransferase PyrR [Accumulibacter sp.]MDS4048569.1 bifunctional pyr operon transcriptional regulator/uracil phosphoribosyltransferase PyrR [Accumulibacter sp.]